jgi:hypothetical protein
MGGKIKKKKKNYLHPITGWDIPIHPIPGWDIFYIPSQDGTSLFPSQDGTLFTSHPRMGHPNTSHPRMGHYLHPKP